VPDLVVRPLLWPQDRAALCSIDATLHTDERAWPVLNDPAAELVLRLSYSPLPAPLVKAQPVPGTDHDRAPWEHGVVAELAGRVVGVAGSHHVRWNNRQVLDALYVDVSARRRGAGRALVMAVLQHAVRGGARQLWLETQDVNAPALRAYEAMGFSLVGLDTTLYGQPYEHETALYLARDLS